MSLIEKIILLESVLVLSLTYVTRAQCIDSFISALHLKKLFRYFNPIKPGGGGSFWPAANLNYFWGTCGMNLKLYEFS